MNTSQVFFTPVNDQQEWSQTARTLLEKLASVNKLSFPETMPVKVHTGEPGNISFIQPKYMDGMIDFLEENGVNPIFMETNMANGARTKTEVHMQIAKEHGFTRIPFVVADGDEEHGEVVVPISNGKHFTECKIASELHKYEQVLIVSHFKGHGMTGFGGALKMLGIGFASRDGKAEAHAKVKIPEGTLIDWDKAVLDGNWDAEDIKWNDDYVYHHGAFMERVAEYGLAAKKLGHIHLVFATNLVKDCDCDGVEMQPLYPDLGIFASNDPVAIDKAILDMLDQRAGKETYWGREIFAYAEKIGLGSQEYELIEVKR